MQVSFQFPILNPRRPGSVEDFFDSILALNAGDQPNSSMQYW